MAKSTRNRTADKPKKPYRDFPLTPHNSGRWCKKIKGKVYFFGRWARRVNGALTTVDNPEAAAQAAVDLYNEQRDALQAGRTPRPTGEGLTVGDLCNQFLNSKRHLVDAREITRRTFQDYHDSCARLVATFGKRRLVDDLRADDFERLRTELAKVRGPVSLANEIGRIRVVLKFATDNGLVTKPIAYGQGFRKPSRKVLRKVRAERGPLIFESAELRKIIDKAKGQAKAMILLGVNCALGQSDLANLPQSAVDLEAGWIDYPRPKTGVERRCPLWPETVAAIRDALKSRPTPNDPGDAGLVFVTKYGARWVRTKVTTIKNGEQKATNIDGVSQEFRKLLKALSINGGRGFYCLRRGFETIGGDSLDQVAVDYIMGHSRDDMASVYRQRISDDRLRAVVEVVRQWLFPDVGK